VTNDVNTGTALPTESGLNPSFENADAAVARPLVVPVVPATFDMAPIALDPPPADGAALRSAFIPGTAFAI